MIVSRRSFFKGIGATAAIASMPKSVLAAISENPRVVAWNLLNEATMLFEKHGKCEAFFGTVETLFDHLVKHFPVKEPPSFEEMVRDCGDLLRARGTYAGDPNQHWETCYDSTFVIMIVREGLKNRKLPMVQAANWKMFAKNYSKVVMAA